MGAYNIWRCGKDDGEYSLVEKKKAQKAGICSYGSTTELQKTLIH